MLIQQRQQNDNINDWKANVKKRLQKLGYNAVKRGFLHHKEVVKT